MVANINQFRISIGIYLGGNLKTKLTQKIRPNMIIDTLNQKIIDAMKAKDEVKLSTLKLLSSEIHNFQIDHPKLTKAEELSVVKKEAKKRKDAIEAYTKANTLE